MSVQAVTITAQLEPEYFPEAVPESAVAAKMGVSLKRLRAVRGTMKSPVHMNAPMGADRSAGEVGETIAVRCLLLSTIF